MSNNKQQTAVEWFIEQLNSKYGGNDFLITHINEIEKAKEMEKQQIKNAYNDGHTDGAIDRPGLTSGTTYYNETYGEDKL
jgi:hypothetical protein